MFKIYLAGNNHRGISSCMQKKKKRKKKKMQHLNQPVTQ